MKKVPDDRRAIRTKKMIRSALIELIEEKGFNNISVSDLTSRADINRGTFYLHYVDKYDLLEQIENEMIQKIQGETSDLHFIDMMSMDAINEPLPFLVKLFWYFKENSTLIKAILGPKGDPTFQNKIKKIMEVNLFEKQKTKKIRKEKMLVPEEYFIPYVLSADIGVVQQWLENDMKESPEEMALILTRIALLGPVRAVGIDTVLFQDQ